MSKTAFDAYLESFSLAEEKEKTLDDFRREYRDAIAAGASPGELENPETAYADYLGIFSEPLEDKERFEFSKEQEKSLERSCQRLVASLVRPKVQDVTKVKVETEDHMVFVRVKVKSPKADNLDFENLERELHIAFMKEIEKLNSDAICFLAIDPED